jgi:hypothetical protein
MMENLVWTSARRCEGGACVEVALGPTVHVRDTKSGEILAFTGPAWAAFIVALKAGTI